jgi:hypothetical protein
MKKSFIAASFCIIAFILITFTAWITCKRGPTIAEVEAHFAELANGRAITVDSEQSDIGYFGVKIDGEEQFFVETSEQWVFPGSPYDWSRGTP